MGWFLVTCGPVVLVAVLVYLVHRVFPHGVRAGYNEEWPALANDQSSPQVEDALYSSMTDRINTINSDRRQRIYAAQPSIE